MKNFKKIVISLIAFSMLLCSMVSAATADDITQAVKDAGFGNYSANISSYLQSHEITNAQGDAIIAQIKKAQAILNGKAFSELTTSEKAELKKYAEEAASVIGLTIKVNAGNITVVDAKGNVVEKITSSELGNLVNALNFDKLNTLVSVATDYHKNPNKSFTASNGTMKKTATSYGNFMVLGVALIVAGGVVFSSSKKKVLA